MSLATGLIVMCIIISVGAVALVCFALWIRSGMQKQIGRFARREPHITPAPTKALAPMESGLFHIEERRKAWQLNL